MTTLTLEQLRGIFRRYANEDFAAASAFLYAAICDGVADDDELLALASETLPGQPPPNLLFGAVHALLLKGEDHRLAAYYPDIAAEPLPREEAVPYFRDFCFAHAKEIRALVRSKRVQTNVLERCGLLLPAFAAAAPELHCERLSLIEVGASAGLNLLWDRYAYDFGGGRTWGSASSPVRLSIEVRGDGALPVIPPGLAAVTAVGVDLEPVDLTDEEDLLWQRALIWPDRPDRQARLSAAMMLAAAAPPRVVEGDACEVLSSLIAETPEDTGLCVFASFSLYQFPREARERLMEMLREAGRARPLVFLRLDGTPGNPADASIDMTVFSDTGARGPMRLLRGHPHGAWMEWLREPPAD